MKTAVVVGANGVIGGNLVEHLQRTGDWNIIGLSRRGGIDSERVQHIAVDLLDGDETRRRLSHLTDVTHIFYAAYQERPTWAELVPPNLAMLVNVVTVIEDSSPNLEHVSLLQGYKVYGAHLGPFKTPARETDPPHMPPEFNIDQQQFLESRQVGKRWSWSAVRPSVVCGVALGNPMNLATVISVYATMCKKLGVPMRFPGKPGAFGSLLEMTDASLLAEATVWAATTPACANQAFNITNGDLFRWNDMWPRIADIFGLDTATPLPMSLADVMADKEPLWNSIVSEHELKPSPYRYVSSWAFGDFVFSWDYDVISDGSKARRMGFHRFVDTEAMFAGIVTDLRQQRIIP